MKEKKFKGMRVDKSPFNKTFNRAKRKQQSSQDLPAIPDKRYFTISEASHLCRVKAYVLRYWEQEFSQLKPIKRRGNRRYYQQSDILLVRQIKALLYENGFTIEGARSQLANGKSANIKAEEEILSRNASAHVHSVVQKVIMELKSVLHNLQTQIKTN